MDRADIKQYVGHPSQAAVYQILHSSLLELTRKGVVATSGQQCLPYRWSKYIFLKVESKLSLPVQTAAAGGTAAHPRHQLQPAAVGRGGEVRGHVGPHHQEDFLPRARSLLRSGGPRNRHLGRVLGELGQGCFAAIEGPRGIYQGKLI